MVNEGTRPQNSLSKAGNRPKSCKTDIHHTFSSLLVCPECMNPGKALPCCSQACTDIWGGYKGRQRMVHQKQTQQVEGKFDMEIVSLIATTSCWCYLTFAFCTHMVDFAKSGHILCKLCIILLLLL